MPSKREISIRLAQAEQRIRHLMFLQSMQHDTIQVQVRTINRLNDLVIDLVAGRRS